MAMVLFAQLLLGYRLLLFTSSSSHIPLPPTQPTRNEWPARIPGRVAAISSLRHRWLRVCRFVLPTECPSSVSRQMLSLSPPSPTGKCGCELVHPSTATLQKRDLTPPLSFAQETSSSTSSFISAHSNRNNSRNKTRNLSNKIYDTIH